MSIFDPLRFLSNFMITEKLLMLEVWRHGLRWDDVWNSWQKELPHIKVVNIPRCDFRISTSRYLELHVFVDASEDEFVAVSYWRSITVEGIIEVSFVAAKNRFIC